MAVYELLVTLIGCVFFCLAVVAWRQDDVIRRAGDHILIAELKRRSRERKLIKEADADVEKTLEGYIP